MRLTWMFTLAAIMSVPQMRITVNIPAFRLDVRVADSVVRTMAIAVGAPGYRTPRGEFAITSVEWNPWWIPPDRPWAAKERPTRPGPTNPMGRVKLNFRPLYFLHGTPLVASIGSAASHGCIRLTNADAIELARLVHRFGSPRLSTDDIDQLARDTVTSRLLDLDEVVPLELRYDLVEIRGETLSVYRDIYDLASRPLRAEIYAAISARGLDTSLIDTARVRALVRRIPPKGNSVVIDSLMRGGDAFSPLTGNAATSLATEANASRLNVKQEWGPRYSESGDRPPCRRARSSGQRQCRRLPPP